MKNKGIARVTALLLLLALLLGTIPLSGMVSAVSAETEPTDAELQETVVSEHPISEEPISSEDGQEQSQEPQETETPEFTEETDVPSETEPEEPAPTEASEEDLTWMDAGLLLLVNGTLVPYNPATGEADPSAVGGGKRAVPSGIY